MEDIVNEIKNLEKFCKKIQKGNFDDKLELPKKSSKLYNLYKIADQMRKNLEINSKKCIRLQDALEESISGLAIISPKEKVSYVNSAWADMYGYKSSEIIGKDISIFFNQDDYKEKIKKALKSTKLNNPIELEVKSIKNDGKSFPSWIKIKALQKKSGFVITGKDISKIKQAEQKLSETKQMFENAFNYAPIGMALVDLKGGWIKVNKALSDMLGYKPQELYKMTFQDITHPEDLEKDLEYMNQLIDGQIENYSMKKRYINKDKSIVFAELYGSVIKNEQNEPLYFVAQIVDTTKINKTTIELKKKLEEVDQMNKLLVGRELKMMELKDQIKSLKK